MNFLSWTIVCDCLTKQCQYDSLNLGLTLSLSISVAWVWLRSCSRTLGREDHRPRQADAPKAALGLRFLEDKLGLTRHCTNCVNWISFGRPALKKMGRLIWNTIGL